MTRFRIDAARSRVVIDASSSLHPIHSESRGVEGWIDIGVRDGHITDLGGATAHLELPVDQLRSGNPLEERELKRRIDAKHHPQITGELTSIEADGDGTYRVAGDVTFRGETRPAHDVMSITVDDDGSLRLQGSSGFDVRDFGMEPPKILLIRVHPDVKVTVDIVAVAEA